jgi:hypothetical protein
MRAEQLILRFATSATPVSHVRAATLHNASRAIRCTPDHGCVLFESSNTWPSSLTRRSSDSAYAPERETSKGSLDRAIPSVRINGLKLMSRKDWSGKRGN